MLRRGAASPRQQHRLPPGGQPVRPVHQPEPQDVLPADKVVFRRQSVAALRKAAQPRVQHTPPVAPAAAADVDAHRIVPPGGQLTGGVAPGGEVHIHKGHPHRGTDALCGQRPLRRQLKLQKPPRRPRPRLRCTLRRALLHHGKHRVPHPEFGALVSHGIAGCPDVQPQGVGAQRCPGIQLGAPPVQPLQSAAQRKARQQAGAQQPHLPDGKRL